MMMINNPEKVISPYGLVNVLNKNFHNRLSFFDQLDICEVHTLICEKIHNEIGVGVKENADQCKKTINLQNNMKKSKWNSLFQGVLNINTICLSCGHTIENYEGFITLNLDIPQFSTNVINLIIKYFEPEQLGDYKCDKCKGCNCIRKSNLQKIPQVFTFALKRFDFQQSGVKNNIMISIPEYLVFDTTKYKLKASANHFGNCNGGHYNATCLNKDNKWFLFDDNSIQQAQFNFENNNSSYLLFYERI